MNPAVPELLDRLDGPVTAFLVYGVGGLLLAAHVAFALYRWFFHRRAEAQARAEEAKAPSLAPGFTSLCGVVETDGEEAAITLTLWEEGTEWHHKGSWHHRWRERSRAMEARSFTLRLASGERVRVVPDERVIYVDSLQIRLFTGAERERTAELKAGQEVRVDGMLLRNRASQRAESVYRGGEAPRYTLRGGRAEPLQVAVGGLSGGHQRWATWYRWAALVLGATLASVQLLAYGPYHALRAAGQVVEASIVDGEVYTTATRSGGRMHFGLKATFKDARGKAHALSDEVPRATYEAARDRTLQTIPFLVVPWDAEIHQVGTTPALSNGRGMLGHLAVVVAILLFWVMRRQVMPWYEQRRVVERGPGSLASSVMTYEESAPAQVSSRVSSAPAPHRNAS
ncbi:hypothetical protein [Chondromyces apiculatus]|uniref:Uncharacterized protein n=1 Tax=Chondromyces apiculatus DSM 436 TaxID=1192034 RepID=A0A017T9Y1_9BACT|nr:hypothetical protein [Chondromyces apiculatus]EYF06063.1 Hypothetical protein CAP_2253 [Chondromyces apiculatus DSM 436]